MGRRLVWAAVLASMLILQIATFAIPVSAAAPDLVVDQVYLGNPSVQPTQKTKIWAIVKNVGDAKSQPYYLAFYIDNSLFNEIFINADLHPEYGTHSDDAGRTWEYPGGFHTIQVCVDSRNNNSESNESNNCTSIQVGSSAPTEKITTTLDLSVCPSTGSGYDCTSSTIAASTNVQIRIDGMLKRSDNQDGISGRTIQLSWPGGSTSVTTLGNGGYSYTVNVNLQGSATFSASFAGDDAYKSASNSKTLNAQIIVTPPQPPSLISYRISPTTVNAGEPFRGFYTINNPAPYSVSVGLGLSIKKSGSYNEIVDRDNDITVNVSPGTNEYARSFRVPSGESGSYDVAMAIWSGQVGSSTQLQSSGWMSNMLTVCCVVPPPPPPGPTTTTVRITLSSSANDGRSNIGQITFDGSPYSLSTSITKEKRTTYSYSATASPPSGYVFDYWETSGGVKVSNSGIQTTGVSAEYDGTLKVVFRFSDTGTFSIYASKSSLNVEPGKSDSTTITITPVNGFTGSVSLTVVWSPRPNWITHDFVSPNVVSLSGNPVNAVLSITTSSSAIEGNYRATIVGISDQKSSEYPITLVVDRGDVIEPPDEIEPPDTIGDGVNADITFFSVDPGEFEHGERIYTKITVKNTGEVRQRFYVGLSMMDPAGTWYDIPSTYVYLSPQESDSASLSWSVPYNAMSGNYLARAAVYEQQSGEQLIGRLDLQEISNAFAVITPPLPNLSVDAWTESLMYVSGQQINIFVLVENNGRRDATIQIYTKLLDSTGRVVKEGSQSSTIMIQGGDQKKIGIDKYWSVDESSSGGRYTLIVYLIDSNSYSRISNEITKNFDVSVKPKPTDIDLSTKITKITPSQPIEGDIVKIEGEFSKYGSYDGQSRVVIYVDDKAISERTVMLQDTEFATLSVSWKAIEGKHTIKIMVDELDVIRETNELNNLDKLIIDVEPRIEKPSELLTDISGYVTYYDGFNQVPLEGARVKISWGFIDSKTTYTDSRGKYQFNDLPVNAVIGNNIFNIRTELDDDKYVVVHTSGQTLPFNIELKQITLPDREEVMLEDIEFIDDIEAGSARIFSITRQIAKFYEREFDLKLDPVHVYTFLKPLDQKSAWYNPLTKEIDVSEDFSVVFQTYTFDIMAMEYTHYVQHILFSDLHRRLGDKNHVGFSNPSTADSWIEGLGTFMPLLVKDISGDENTVSFFGGINIENNIKVDDSNYRWGQYDQAEEMAIAGILWDLYDNAATRDGSEQTDDDNVSMSITEIWKIINTVQEFPQYYDIFGRPVSEDLTSQRHIFYMKDLYDVLVKYDVNHDRKVDSNDENFINEIFDVHGVTGGLTDSRRPDRV